MAEIKTKPGEYNVEDYLEQLDAKRLDEAEVLIDMMHDITGFEPMMWGSSIIGFHPFHYKSKSGSEGDWPRIGFSPRKGKISLYVTFNAEEYLPEVELLGGKTSVGKGCIYLSKFDQVDLTKLRQLVKRGYDDSFKAYPAK